MRSRSRRSGSDPTARARASSCPRRRSTTTRSRTRSRSRTTTPSPRVSPRSWPRSNGGGSTRASPGRTGRARVHPRAEGRGQLGPGDGYGRAARAGIPAPAHELVIRDVVEHGREILASRPRRILDDRAELAGREGNEDHGRPRGGQVPVGRARRHVRAVARGRVSRLVTGRAGQAGRALSVGPALDVLPVRPAVVELQGRVPWDVAVLTARVLEDL